MTSQESKRLDLYNRLQEVLGADPATTLMAYLPPVETPDLLTRSEFKGAISKIEAQLDRFEGRFDEVDRKIDRVLLAVVGGLFVVIAAIVSAGLLG